MSEIYQIIRQKEDNTAYTTNGGLLFNAPMTVTSLLFLGHFLEKDIKCHYQPVEGDNQLRLDGDPFRASDNDVYLFKDILIKDKKTDHYQKYIQNLQAIAVSAAPFYGANAYEIVFPSVLYAKYEKEIEELMGILSDENSIAAKGVQITKSVLGIGKNKIIPLLLNVGEKKKDNEGGGLDSLIQGKITLTPVINYFTISQLETDEVTNGDVSEDELLNDEEQEGEEKEEEPKPGE